MAALGHTFVAGPKCNVAFLKALAGAAEFRAEKFDTLPADAEAVKLHIRERSRAWSSN